MAVSRKSSLCERATIGHRVNAMSRNKLIEERMPVARLWVRYDGQCLGRERRQSRVSMERIRAAANSLLMRLAQKMIVGGALFLDRVANSHLYRLSGQKNPY